MGVLDSFIRVSLGSVALRRYLFRIPKLCISIVPERRVFNSAVCKATLKPNQKLDRQNICRSVTETMPAFKYPTARRDESIEEDHFGMKIKDPYRWMEDPDAEDTKKFVDEQNKLTFPFLEQYKKRDHIRNILTNIWDYPRYTCPSKRGNKFFYKHNTGLQNQSVLFMQDSLDGEPTVFLDPNKLSDDGTVSLQTGRFSENGKYYAYGLSESGSDWCTIHIKEVETKQDLPEVLRKVKFSTIAWTHDHKGFFYSQYPDYVGDSKGSEATSVDNQKLYYHRINTPQSEDILCWDCPDNPKWRMSPEISDCGKYLIIEVSEGCKDNQIYYTSLEGDVGPGRLTVIPLIDKFEAQYEYVTNEGRIFTFHTNKDRPRYGLVNIDLEDSDPSSWKDLIPEHNVDVLEWAACSGQNKLVLCYMRDVRNTLFIHDLATGDRLKEVVLPLGSVVGYSGRKEDNLIFFEFTSYSTPGVINSIDLTKPDFPVNVFKEIKLKNYSTDDMVTKQIFYTSKDGTKIPMFVTHREGLELNGNAPCLLYGYGGFNIPLKPAFSIFRLMLAKELGFVCAVANIRGGGEYGEEWHIGGRLGNKQNVFDDFAAAAEYLIDSGYTSKGRLAIQGGSNGGLLVGSSLNQRPDLYSAGIAQVGVLDMLRFHKFTIGHAWISDYGNPEVESDFKTLIKYSPLHNIPEGDKLEHQYPSVLLVTGDHDDRVVPSHSLKFIAQLQYQLGGLPKQTNPLLVRVDTKSGHGAGKPTTKVIEELVDIVCFIMQTLKINTENENGGA